MHREKGHRKGRFAIGSRNIRAHEWGQIATMADPFGNGICFLQFLNRGYDEIALGDEH